AALVMRELEGRSYAEIADILEITPSAVETLIFRARRALREQLESSLTCGEAELAISRQLDGRLSRAEKGALRAHLRECKESGACGHRCQPRSSCARTGPTESHRRPTRRTRPARPHPRLPRRRERLRASPPSPWRASCRGGPSGPPGSSRSSRFRPREDEAAS